MLTKKICSRKLLTVTHKYIKHGSNILPTLYVILTYKNYLISVVVTGLAGGRGAVHSAAIPLMLSV
jgi:hypothetical protein